MTQPTLTLLLALLAGGFGLRAEVTPQAHNNLKDAGGIRDAAEPRTLTDQAGKSPDLARQGSPRVMSKGPEARGGGSAIHPSSSRNRISVL